MLHEAISDVNTLPSDASVYNGILKLIAGSFLAPTPIDLSSIPLPAVKTIDRNLERLLVIIACISKFDSKAHVDNLLIPFTRLLLRVHASTPQSGKCTYSASALFTQTVFSTNQIKLACLFLRVLAPAGTLWGKVLPELTAFLQESVAGVWYALCFRSHHLFLVAVKTCVLGMPLYA